MSHFDEEDEVGALRSRRGARAQPRELDPRFLAPERVGRLVPQEANYGSAVTMLGSQPNQEWKLIRADDKAILPFIVSVTSKFRGGVAGGGFAVQAGVVCKGTFGTGGATQQVEFDAQPGQNVQLAGGSIDLTVAWDTIFRGDAATSSGVAQAVIQQDTLPEFADVAGVAAKGGTSRGTATRTRPFFNFVGAGNWIMPVPTFADALMLMLSNDGAYANITSLELLTSVSSGPSPVGTYTGAQLLAFKNAGIPIPLPGMVLAVRITTVGLINSWFVYNLSL